MKLTDNIGTGEPAGEPTENDLLVAFEREFIPKHYKEFYVPKRHNLFATIQKLPDIWNCFMRLDEIVLRELEVMQRLSSADLGMPMVLLMNAQTKMRISFELACSSAIPEAHSILRDAIESAGHAHRLASDPKLLKLWLEKDESETAAEAYKQEFIHHKANRLFDSLPDLHELWKQFSESGSHTNLNSIIPRFEIADTATDREFRLHYTGVRDTKLFTLMLFEMVLVFGEIEKVIFKLGEDRLKLDHKLVEMRHRYDIQREQVRARIITAFQIQPPARRTARAAQ